jgi:hypothetical protein
VSCVDSRVSAGARRPLSFSRVTDTKPEAAGVVAGGPQRPGARRHKRSAPACSWSSELQRTMADKRSCPYRRIVFATFPRSRCPRSRVNSTPATSGDFSWHQRSPQLATTEDFLMVMDTGSGPARFRRGRRLWFDVPVYKAIPSA